MARIGARKQLSTLPSMPIAKPTLLSLLRDEYLLEKCSGKKVLHIGACDAPFTKEKFENKLLLHNKLADSAAELIGVDVDDQSIKFLQEKGITNILKIDMNHIETINFQPEVIVFGETIEHLDNIKNGLTTLTRVMGKDSRLLISTPNAFSLLNFVNALLRKEHCHPDHVVNFTPKTLEQCLLRSELEVEELNFTFLNRHRFSVYKKVWRKIAMLAPWYAETLVVSCKLQ